jgi:hypothetical protein
LDLGISYGFQVFGIEGGNVIEQISFLLQVTASRIIKIENRVADRTEFDALMIAGKEARPPKSGVDGLGLRVRILVQQNDVGGQV